MPELRKGTDVGEQRSAHREDRPAIDEGVEVVRPAAVAGQDMSKRYGETRALDGLRFSAPAGEVTAVLGPNGAGKTTLFECITGLRKLDGGSLEVLGLDPARDRRSLALRLGVQVQEFNLQEWVRAREALAFFASLHPTSTDVDELLERFGLADKWAARFPSLSGGQKRRLAIARALVGDPELVVLDEPTAGLDPQGQMFINNEIRRLRVEGRTVLVSTHDVQDAAEVADHVLIIDHGRCVMAGTPQEIVERSPVRDRVVLSDPDGRVPFDRDDLEPAEQLFRLSEGWLLLTPDGEAWRASLEDAGPVTVNPVGLRDVYMHVTGRELRS